MQHEDKEWYQKVQNLNKKKFKKVLDMIPKPCYNVQHLRKKTKSSAMKTNQTVTNSQKVNL